jgi:hypothetical protein
MAGVPPVCNSESASLINGSFEQLPTLPTSPNNENWRDFNGGSPPEQFLLVKDSADNDQIVGWQTTASDNYIEIQRQVSGFVQDGTDSAPGYWDRKSAQPAHGSYWAELNAYEASALYQDIEALAGEVYYWSILHRGRVFGTADEMKVLIGPPGSIVQQTSITRFLPTNANVFIGSPTYATTGASVSTIATRLEDGWTRYQGSYIPTSSGPLRFQFEAVTASFANRVGNLLDGISFSPFRACDAIRTLKVGESVDIDVALAEFVFGEAYSLGTVATQSGDSGTFGTNGSVIRFSGLRRGTTSVTYTVEAVLGGSTVTRTGTLTFVVDNPDPLGIDYELAGRFPDANSDLPDTR